jgi:hypothetical protein
MIRMRRNIPLHIFGRSQRHATSSTASKPFTPVRKAALKDIPEIRQMTDAEEDEMRMREILDSKAKTCTNYYKKISPGSSAQEEDVRMRLNVALKKSQERFLDGLREFRVFWTVTWTLIIIYVYTQWKHGVLLWSYADRFEH